MRIILKYFKLFNFVLKSIHEICSFEKSVKSISLIIKVKLFLEFYVFYYFFKNY